MLWRSLTDLDEVIVYFYSTGEYLDDNEPQMIKGTIISCEGFLELIGTEKNFYVHKCKKIT